MGRWQCRKQAAKARMENRPKGPTPRSEIKAMRVQATEIQDWKKHLDKIGEKLEKRAKDVVKNPKKVDKDKAKTSRGKTKAKATLEKTED